MKLLLAGSDEPWSIERHFVKYLRIEGIPVETVPLQSHFYRYYNRSVVNKLLYRSGLSGIQARLDKEFRSAVEQLNPDVIWVFKGMEITPESLKWAAARGIRLVNYNPDNPFIFTGKGSGNKNVRTSIGLYDLHFTYDRDIQEKIKTEYGIRCLLLPFGFELSEEHYLAAAGEKEVVRACFLGNPDQQRVIALSEIADAVPIDVYGEGWNKFLNHNNIIIHPPVYGEEFWKVLRKYRAQLNLMRIHNPLSHNMRSFEIPGVGGIGVFPRTRDHSQYFNDGSEVFLYEGVRECREVLSEVLNMTEEEAGRIRVSARKKSLDAGYSYHGRTIQVIKGIQDIL